MDISEQTMYLKELLLENRLPSQLNFRRKLIFSSCRLSVLTVKKNYTSILGGVGEGGGGGGLVKTVFNAREVKTYLCSISTYFIMRI